jgi:methionyl-tRNA formyltransferase
MKTVTVLKAHPYGAEKRKPGQVCLVEDNHVGILEKAGLVMVSDVPVTKKPLMDFVDPDPDEIPKTTKRRTYRRRDLQAED